MVVGLASRSTGRWRGNKSEVFRPCRGMIVTWDSSFGEGGGKVLDRLVALWGISGLSIGYPEVRLVTKAEDDGTKMGTIRQTTKERELVGVV